MKVDDVPLAPITTEDKAAVQGTNSLLNANEDGPYMKNMVVVKRQDGYYTSIRNGIYVYDTVANDVGQGCYNSAPVGNMAIKDGVLYKGNFSSGYAGMTNVGTVSSHTNYAPAYMEDWNKDTVLIKTTDELNEYDGTTLTEVTDADYPDFTGQGMVFLNDYVFVLDVGNTNGEGVPAIYNSNLGDYTAWTSTDYIETSDQSDVGYGIALHHDHIVYFGKKHIEFYYDAANPTGSPLARRKDIRYNVGINSTGVSANKQFIEYGDDIYFIGTKDKLTSLYVLRRFQVQKLTEINIDNVTSLSDIYIAMVRSNGKEFVSVQLASRGTYWFDIELGITSYITHGDTSFAECDIGFTMLGQNSLFQGSDATLGTFASSNNFQVYKDQNSSATDIDIDWSITTPVFSGESTYNKFLHSLEIVGDYTASEECFVSWTDDNYQNFSTPKTLNIAERRKLTRCGKFNRRAFRISGSDQVRLSFKRLQLTYSEGSV